MERTDDRGLAEVRRLLDDAQGYAVLRRDGKRVGIFIELAGGEGDQIAIRRDRVFLWRREELPLTSVADVVPERRLILLGNDAQAIDGAAPDDDLRLAAEELDWRGRIESYVSAADDAPDRHLRFISTSTGYTLTEAEGMPPSPGSSVAVPDEVVPFVVMRVGRSPLPNDDRICAYLAPE